MATPEQRLLEVKRRLGLRYKMDSKPTRTALVADTIEIVLEMEKEGWSSAAPDLLSAREWWVADLKKRPARFQAGNMQQSSILSGAWDTRTPIKAYLAGVTWAFRLFEPLLRELESCISRGYYTEALVRGVQEFKKEAGIQ